MAGDATKDPGKPLREVAEKLTRDLIEALQENDPEKLAEYERLEKERDARIAEAIEEMRKEGKLPSMKGKTLPPK